MAAVTRITCRATVLSPSTIYCRCMAPVTRFTCRATVLARTPSIVVVWRLSPVLHVELLF